MERILITGGTGSLGQKLTEKLLNDKNIKEIRIYSRNEKNHYLMAKKFTSSRLKFILGDVRDYNRLFEALKGVDTVIHAAALKHITMGEIHPEEFIKTNILGTINVLKCSNALNVKTLIYVSTDKACQPTNLYGMTKSIGERLICSDSLDNSEIRKIGVRYGNVAGSNGSVIPYFRKLINEGLPLTITDNQMTRFFITLDDAVDLILFAYKTAKNQEILVRKAPSFKIKDLAEFMLENYSAKNSEVKIIGLLSYGEKIHEVLVSEAEISRSEESGPYIIIKKNNVKEPLDKEYTSKEVSDKIELKKLFDKIGEFKY